MKKPNVIFLSVDALRADRTSLHGYSRQTTPNLEKMAKEAIVCDQAVSMGAHTQVSFHSLMTSSRPYSYHGYDKGAHGRPASLFEAFSKGGYETVTIATFPWVTRYQGYKGISRENFTFILNAFVGLYGGGTMGSILRAWHGGDMSDERVVELTAPWIRKVFDHSEDYCHVRQMDHDRNMLDFSHCYFMNEGFDYERVLKSISRHRKTYEEDPKAYLERHLTKVPSAHDWLGKEWRYFCRTNKSLIKEGWERIHNRALHAVKPASAVSRKHKYKRYVDAAHLADRVLREARERKDQDKPFLLWTHFVDTHEPYTPGALPHWEQKAPEYLKRLNYPGDIDLSLSLKGKPKTDDAWKAWSAFYDATVLYVDEQIGRICRGLKDLGIDKDTIIIACGDHGEELGEHGDISHHFRLHEHNIRVPLIFHRPGMEAKRISSLITLMDIAPSIANLCGVDAVDEWAGKCVTSDEVAERQEIVIETFHGGNCLFESRPLYMAVRTKEWKYLWKEYIDPTDHYSPARCELYDIISDPLEQENLYTPGHHIVEAFNPLILKRLSEVPEVSSKRLSSIAAQMGGDCANRITAL